MFYPWSPTPHEPMAYGPLGDTKPLRGRFLGEFFRLQPSLKELLSVYHAMIIHCVMTDCKKKIRGAIAYEYTAFYK